MLTIVFCTKVLGIPLEPPVQHKLPKPLKTKVMSQDLNIYYHYN